MPGPLVICSEHGLVEDGSGISIDDGSTITIKGSRGQCPLCGRRAPYADGSYKAVSGRVSAVLRLSPAQAIRLRNSAQWARDQLAQGADEEDIRERVLNVVEKEAPAWKAAIETLLSDRAVGLYQLLGFILMLLVFFGLDPASRGANDTPPPPAITEEEMRRLFEEFVERERDTPSLPGPEREESSQESPPTQGA